MKSPSRLHVGCGHVYKPGYWNIDKFEGSVADEIADVSRLKYGNCTIDELISSQLIEHFDLIQSKYVISEWFRVLKPNGKLVLETPDLKESAKRLIRGRVGTQKRLMSWVFGIDSPGMQHKVCFTYDILKEILEHIGFVDVQRERPKTHGYAPGMRIVCRRPEGAEESLFVAITRKHVLTRLGNPDSYVLMPLENHLLSVLGLVKGPRGEALDLLDRALARASACNPALAMAVIDAAEESEWFDPGMIAQRRKIIDALVAMDFPSRAFALWIRSKKGPDIASDFEAFAGRLEKTVLDVVKCQLSISDGFDYLMNLHPEHIDILDFELAMMEARKMFNLGVKAFAQQDFEKGRTAFEAAAGANPLNPYVHWNLARLEFEAGSEKAFVLGLYEKAARFARDEALRGRISRESHRLAGGERPPPVPLQMPWE